VLSDSRDECRETVGCSETDVKFMEKQNKRAPKLIYKQAELNGVRQDISWRIYVNFPSGCILLLYQAPR